MEIRTSLEIFEKYKDLIKWVENKEDIYFDEKRWVAVEDVLYEFEKILMKHKDCEKEFPHRLPTNLGDTFKARCIEKVWADFCKLQINLEYP